MKTHIDPVTGCRVPYTPMGRFIDVPPPCPRSDWANNFGRPWWRLDKYCIGNLSQKTRRLRLINTLTLQEQTIEVCVCVCVCVQERGKMVLFLLGFCVNSAFSNFPLRCLLKVSLSLSLSLYTHTERCVQRSY